MKSVASQPWAKTHIWANDFEYRGRVSVYQALNSDGEEMSGTHKLWV